MSVSSLTVPAPAGGPKPVELAAQEFIEQRSRRRARFAYRDWSDLGNRPATAGRNNSHAIKPNGKKNTTAIATKSGDFRLLIASLTAQRSRSTAEAIRRAAYIVVPKLIGPWESIVYSDQNRMRKSDGGHSVASGDVFRQRSSSLPETHQDELAPPVRRTSDAGLPGLAPPQAPQAAHREDDGE
jgi:hypothetical protein